MKQMMRIFMLAGALAMVLTGPQSLRAATTSKIAKTKAPAPAKSATKTAKGVIARDPYLGAIAVEFRRKED